MNEEPGSITHWIGFLRDGNEEAAQQVWQRFHDRLLAHARNRLAMTKKRVADEDDVVVCAFNSFFQGAHAGRFPDLNDRDDLWQVLLMLVNRKAANQMKELNRQKRGQSVTRGDSMFAAQENSDRRNDLQCPEPPHELVVQIAEKFEVLLRDLEDPTLKEIALMKMEGNSNRDIANKIQCQERTVQRKLGVIRKLWMLSE